MAEPKEALPVKLFCGAICTDGVDADEVEVKLAELFGSVERRFGPHRFDIYTKYYCRQMGDVLWRYFFVFEPLRMPDFLTEAKLSTNRLEHLWYRDGRRCVNLDPGYIHPARLVLASCKDFAHRIYLCRGVYAEVTMLWRRGTWSVLPWTFPDFAGGAYFGFFEEVRRHYIHQLNRHRSRK